MLSDDNQAWPLLLKRFPKPEYVLLPEVRDMAGLSASRTADAVAVNLWPSRGLAISGIEIKSSRSDWLRELKNPMKAEAVMKYCDFWYLVATATDIVRPEEIPVNWGLMEISKGRLKTIKEAPQLTPIPVTKHFMAALLKKATSDMVPEKSLEAIIEERVDARLESKLSYEKKVGDNLRKELHELTKKVQEFEAESGVRIRDKWRLGEIAKSVNFVKEGGINNIRNNIEIMRDNVQKMLANMDSVLAETQSRREQDDPIKV